jgi:hypothetical protein
MKKSSIIILILIYSISISGVGLKEFYCCGKLRSVTIALTGNKEEKCNNGDNKDGCCKSKYQLLKVNDKHLASFYSVLPFKNNIEFLSSFILFQPIIFSTCQKAVIEGSPSPPVHSGVPIYLSNCVFRI